MTVPLSGADVIPTTSLEVFSLSANVLKSVIGLFIASIAYRGYRRNDSRPMLVLSIGFVLVLGLPFAAFLSLFLVPPITLAVVTAISELSQLAGLVLILYALRMQP